MGPQSADPDRGLCMAHFEMAPGIVGHCLRLFEHLGEHGATLVGDLTTQVLAQQREIEQLRAQLRTDPTPQGDT